MKYFTKISFLTILISTVLICSCNQKENLNKEIIKSYNQDDYNDVKTAITDYVEGLYFVDSTKIDKSVDLKLRKVGFWYHPEKKAYVDNLEMTHAQLSKLAATWNKNGNRANDNSLKKIEIFDVNTKTASAKLTAEWGIDLFHLAKVNDKWKIVNVIWQSQPENKN